MPNNKVSCLIPFYNESNRILPVLKVITSVALISEIICIDDGSTDSMSEVITKRYPSVRILKIAKNSGKSTAVQKGLALANNEYILLMDADLKKINDYEIATALKTVLRNEHIDMLILRRVNAPWFVKFDRGDLLFSGERILRKADLVNILNKKVMRYQLEIAINIYMQESNKNVYWMPSSAINTYKTKKWGLLDGLKKEKSMFSDIISYAGWICFLKQILTFGRNKMIIKYKPEN